MAAVTHKLSSRMSALYIVVLSITFHFIWFKLDANPLLFIYDAYLTIVYSIQSQTHTKRVFNGNSNNIKGKTIWITGASSGIGAELSLQLASAGVGHLILSGRRVDKLEAVAKSCRDIAESALSIPNNRENNVEHILRVSLVPFDMSGKSDVIEEAVTSALQHAGTPGIDTLILNAGQYQCSPALETDVDAALPSLMKVNFESPVLLSQKLIQSNGWRERRHGHIVVISSLMARGASPLNAIYASTKHALRGYFHSLGAEERHWLRVDVVLPGATDTNLWEGSLTATTSEDDDGNEQQESSSTSLHADSRSKMPVQRCAQLIMTSIMGPHAIFYETWITHNPGLLWVTLASYEPNLFQLATNIIAPLRVGLWRKSGEGAFIRCRHSNTSCNGH
jgi:short-subunit dehydrogenase